MAERYRPDPNSGAYGDDQVEPDHTGCLCFSARICPLLGAQRVGNMVVLKSSHEWVEEITEDEETGERTTHRYTRPVLNIVVGPYWPMMAFVTYPLILGISGWTFVTGILPGGKPFPIVLGWAICTVGLIVALAFTACSDPGIMHRYREAPPQYEGIWRWSDQALTYRPKGAYYDSDTAVVVEDFDHTYVFPFCLICLLRILGACWSFAKYLITNSHDGNIPFVHIFLYSCPWTGTAIGRGNIIAFQTFVCLIFVCMIMDIFLITGAI